MELPLDEQFSSIQDALSCATVDAAVGCTSPIGVPVIPDVVFGGLSCVVGPGSADRHLCPGSCDRQAEALIITFLLNDMPNIQVRRVQCVATHPLCAHLARGHCVPAPSPSSTRPNRPGSPVFPAANPRRPPSATRVQHRAEVWEKEVFLGAVSNFSHPELQASYMAEVCV